MMLPQCDWLLCGDYDGCLGDAARSALLHFDITVLSVRGPDLQGSFRLPADTVAVRGSCREASAILRGELPGAFVCFSWIGNPPNSPGDVTLIAEAPGRGAEVGSICRRTIDLLGSIGVKILLCSSTVPDTVRFCLAAVDIVVVSYYCDLVDLHHILYYNTDRLHSIAADAAFFRAGVCRVRRRS